MIRVENLAVRVGKFGFSGLSFVVETGRYAVLMGKTGCGKTTLVETICGLRSARAGRIVLADADVTRLKPGEREIGYVPQDLALFPTMSVRQHLGFALEVRGLPGIAGRAEELARLLGLTHLLDRLPAGLSGGESQRVALGRALSFNPRVLLLDEPLSALDEETREEMYEVLRSVQRQTGLTTLHITHSKAEARALGDQLFLFRDGAIHEETP
jgi:molybdate transport system ATP-binding protein/molybdate/tungstate transport system ATP-binding protein